MTKDICKNETVAQSAFDYIYYRDLYDTLPECPVPCVNMITTFGYPNIGKKSFLSKGRVYLLFKNLVKVTEDFISYDLLRFIKILLQSEQLYNL